MIELEPIPASSVETLDRLFQLYAHDWSEWLPLALDERGRFGATPSPDWWAREGHWPFFLRDAGALVGFALVSRGSRAGGSADAMDMGEFFVVRGARRRGTGSAAVRALFARFPGPWEARVRRSNPNARAFWARLAGSAPRPYTRDGVDWEVFSWAGDAL